MVDSDQVTAFFEDPQGRWPESDWVQAEEFWKDEKDLIGTAKPVPRRVDDLVIYELHVGALGVRRSRDPARSRTRSTLLDYLVDLGVNAVELLPMSEFSGEENWGYGTSHYFAIEYSGGGRDQYKYFIKACHRRGIAVIFDVVYNHFTPNGEPGRVEYDTDDVMTRTRTTGTRASPPTTPPTSGRSTTAPGISAATSTTCRRASPPASTRRWSGRCSSAAPSC